MLIGSSNSNNLLHSLQSKRKKRNLFLHQNHGVWIESTVHGFQFSVRWISKRKNLLRFRHYNSHENIYHKSRLEIGWHWWNCFILKDSCIDFKFRVTIECYDRQEIHNVKFWFFKSELPCHWMEKCFAITIRLSFIQCNRKHSIEPLIFESIEIVFGQFEFILQIGMIEWPHTIFIETENGWTKLSWLWFVIRISSEWT